MSKKTVGFKGFKVEAYWIVILGLAPMALGWLFLAFVHMLR